MTSAASPNPKPVAAATRRGGSITIAAQAVQTVLGIFTGAYLARLLTPDAFGLFAIAMVPFGLLATVREFGLTAAIVRANTLSPHDLSGLFWLSLRYGAYLAAAMLLLTPPLVWFYGEPWLWLALPALANVLLLQAVGIVPLGLLRRQMRFGWIVAAEVTAFVTAAAVALTMAWYGAGAWALVMQIVLQQAGVAALVGGVALVQGWRPGSFVTATPAAQLREHVTFGREATLSRLVLNFGRAFDFAAIGRAYGAASLGLYERAFVWAQFPSRQIQTPLVYVAVSGLSGIVRRIEKAEAAGDVAKQRDAAADYRRSAGLGLGILLALVFPAQVILIVEAPAVVRVLLGEQWIAASSLLVILSAALAFQNLGRCVKWIYLAEGRTRQQLRSSLVETPVLIVGICCGLPFGVEGVAWAVLVASILIGPGSMAYCVWGGRLAAKDVLWAVARPAVAAVMAGAACVASDRFLRLPDSVTFDEAFVRLVIQSVLFSAVYAAILLGSRGGRAMAVALLPSGLARRFAA